MAHPFEKLFEKALKHSSEHENVVLEEAEKLKEQGYNPVEIHSILAKLHANLIDDGESEILGEATEEFSRFLEA